MRGIGAVMFLTSDRVIVARDGMERRPRSGIQSFPLETVRLIRVERGSGPSGRIVIWGPSGQEVASMFFELRALGRAERFVEEARVLAAGERRRRGGRHGPEARPGLDD